LAGTSWYERDNRVIAEAAAYLGVSYGAYRAVRPEPP
jgi:hypothetical protein